MFQHMIRFNPKMLFGSVVVATSLGASMAHAGDVADGKDHPLISRFAGATLTDYTVTDYDQAFLPSQAVTDAKNAKGLTVEGKLHALVIRCRSKIRPWKVYVVGHTDSQGVFAHNLELSQKRADAIVQAVSATYHIAPNRLVAKGVASLSPVAPNSDDASRARNRRVELVVQ